MKIRNNILLIMIFIMCLISINVAALKIRCADSEENQNDSASLINDDYLDKIELDTFEITDMKIEGTVVTSLSEDSYLVKHFDEGKTFTKLVIDIKEMSTEEIRSQVFYNEVDYISGDCYIEKTLISGRNVMEFSDADNIKTIRIDLTDQKDVVANIEGIYLYIEK